MGVSEPVAVYRSRRAAHSVGVLGQTFLDHVPDRHVGVVAHILSDAGQVHLHGNTLSLQLSGGAETGQHQQLRGSHRSGAQDDLAALHDEGFAAALDLDADGAPAFQGDAVDLHVGADGEVEAVAHGVNVG